MNAQVLSWSGPHLLPSKSLPVHHSWFISLKFYSVLCKLYNWCSITLVHFSLPSSSNSRIIVLWLVEKYLEESSYVLFTVLSKNLGERKQPWPFHYVIPVFRRKQPLSVQYVCPEWLSKATVNLKTGTVSVKIWSRDITLRKVYSITTTLIYLVK
jgi:hypothetical protein